MIGSIIIFTIITLLVYLFKRLTKDNNKWKDMGIPYAKPLPLVGNMLPNVLKRKTLGEILFNICQAKKNDKIIGAYNFTSPILIINDVEYAEIVLIREFSKFMDRGPDMKMSERRPLDKHLFSLTGVEWKAIRSKLSPAFTTVRLNSMIPEINKILHDIPLKYIEENSFESIDLMSVVEVFTMTVRASCVFGMDTTNLSSKSEFISRVREISNFGFSDFVTMTIALWFPRLATKLDISVLRKHEDYFVSLILDEFKNRVKTGSMKNDFVETLLELKRTGNVKTTMWYKEDDYIKEDMSMQVTETVDVDDDILVSASFIFLLAGLDPLRSTSSMVLIDLCKNKHILNKLQSEIDRVIEKHGEINYNALREMQYLENCILESMRIYPPVETIIRHCVREFTFDNGVTVHPGTRVFIPVLKMHTDPNYFEDPMKFNPDRFDSTIQPCSFLPFGNGPRKCIGLRFAMMEMKIFLSQLLYNFDVSLDPKTVLPVQIEKWFFLRRPTTPVYVKFSKRKH